MAIHVSGTFDSVAEFTAEGFRESDIVLHGTDRDGGKYEKLVGHNPMIRFYDGRLILVASDQPNSSASLVSFNFGDVISRLAHAADTLNLVRALSVSYSADR